MVKSRAEVERIRRAVNTNSQAFEQTLGRLRPGLPEREVAAELDFQMRRLGAEGPAFETIVASGSRTALPHARPTGQRLEGNALLLIDMGAFVDGYASDMTRMASLGRPDPKVKKMYRAVLEAQKAAVASVREGVNAGAVDKTARQVLKEHGLEREFVHSTGHGLGLEIHEAPKLGKKEKTRLEAGMVITIEPGAYVEGLGGVRIEDTVLVTRQGCEVLTPTSKELITI
jgi:Xaa-Pro aminopeptidase